MAYITWTDVTDCVSSLGSSPPPGIPLVPVAVQTYILNWVNVVLSANNFGGEGTVKLNSARVFLAAHMGTLFQRGILAGPTGSQGPLVSSTARSLSRTYATVQSTGSKATSHASTIWGELYDEILATTPAAIGVTVA